MASHFCLLNVFSFAHVRPPGGFVYFFYILGICFKSVAFKISLIVSFCGVNRHLQSLMLDSGWRNTELKHELEGEERVVLQLQ